MEPCSCSVLLRRDERFKEGGFPFEMVGTTLKAATWASSCTSDHGQIQEEIKKLVLTPELPVMLLPHVAEKNLASSFRLGAWAAYQVALVYPVRCISVTDLVNASFERGGQTSDLLRFVRTKETGLLIRLGTDAPHSYLGPTLAEALHHRWSRKSPTILVAERPLQQMTGLYGPNAVAALGTYPRLCRCI